VLFWKKDAVGSTRATVTTERPERYGKQLVNHLGRRSGGEWSAEDGSGWITLGAGRATVTATAGGLELAITAPGKQLAGLEKVVGSHLERFGERDALRVEWHRTG
jgi:hypothetical protein